MESFANPFIQIMFVLTMVVISLAGISIRIQKGNQLQKKSIEQSLVKTDANYSEFGIFRQGDRTVIKCPSCAEFISIEAKICKNCHSNVEKQVADLTRKMRELDEDQKKIDEDLRQFLVEQREISAKKRAEQLQKIKKNLPKIILIVVVIIGTLFSGFKFTDNKAKTNAKKNQENLVLFYQREMDIITNKWYERLDFCGFKGVEVTKNYNRFIPYENNDPRFGEKGLLSVSYKELRFGSGVGGDDEWFQKLSCFRFGIEAFYESFNSINKKDGLPNARLYYVADDIEHWWEESDPSSP
jgi:hypothetical protein